RTAQLRQAFRNGLQRQAHDREVIPVEGSHELPPRPLDGIGSCLVQGIAGREVGVELSVRKVAHRHMSRLDPFKDGRGTARRAPTSSYAGGTMRNGSPSSERIS